MLQNTIWQMEEEIQIQKDIKPAHVLKNILWIVVFKQQLTVILVLLRCGGQEWRQESESYAKTIFSTRKKALINIWKLFDWPAVAIYTATIDCTNCTFFHNGTQVSGEALDNYFNVSGAYTDHITIHWSL